MADQLVARALDVRGISIHYWEAGAGRPLLLIHGVTPDHRQMVREWEPAFEGRSGWRRIYPDLPGRGETPGADWIASQDDMLHVTLEFLDAVAPGERFVVGGSSWGGYIALGHRPRASGRPGRRRVRGLQPSSGGADPPGAVRARSR